MNKQDMELLSEVQRNTEMAMLAIETIADKVVNDDMSYQLEKQNLIFSNIHNHAVKELVDANVRPDKNRTFQEMMLKSGIHMNTLFDVSTSHLADLMIRGNVKGITAMCRVLNRQKNIMYVPDKIKNKKMSMAMEVAQELIAFEENCIEKWRAFL